MFIIDELRHLCMLNFVTDCDLICSPTRVRVTKVSVLKDYQVAHCEHHNRHTDGKYRHLGWSSNLKINQVFI